MTVRILFFGSLREALGESLDLELPENATLSGLRARLSADLPSAQASALNEPDVRIALNQDLVHDESLAINDGDEIAFMPAVTGG